MHFLDIMNCLAGRFGQFYKVGAARHLVYQIAQILNIAYQVTYIISDTNHEIILDGSHFFNGIDLHVNNIIISTYRVLQQPSYMITHGTAR